MTRTIIGVDPGLSGGIAIIRDGITVSAFKMPATDLDLFELVRQYNAIAFVERVNAGPKMGSSAAFKFGQNVGAIRMAVIAAGVRLEYVSPQKWQKELGLLSKGRGLGQGDTAKKNRNKARAQELFGNCGFRITHNLADSLLIAHYGQRLLNSTAAAPQQIGR